MATFSTTYGLGLVQSELDFVDVDLATDTKLYVDPYAIQIRQDEWSDSCGDDIRSFFQELMNALRLADQTRVEHLLGHLHEPNETRLGESRGRPRGRGVGDERGARLANALVNSRAFQTGQLHDLSEAELFIHGIGRDTISDLTTNIVRGRLAQYTADQCELHGVQVRPVANIGPVWNGATGDWNSVPLSLPVAANRPVLLVPKFSVRQRLSLDSQEFYNHHMIEFLRAEYLNAGGALVRTLKNGERRVDKKRVKAVHPFVKDDLADFVRNHPQVLETYKSLKGAQGPLQPRDLEEDFDETAFAAALRRQLADVPAGNANAGRYHTLILGICTFLFHPGLIYPKKEFEIHEGRKRIDIKFTNSGEPGFFKRMLEGAQTRAISVFVECKNYTTEIANPELDQLSGRFGHQRGFFGMLLCRNVDDRDRLIARCRDTARDQRGYMLVLVDQDVDRLLQCVEQRRRRQIDRLLDERFNELIN